MGLKLNPGELQTQAHGEMTLIHLLKLTEAGLLVFTRQSSLHSLEQSSSSLPASVTMAERVRERLRAKLRSKGTRNPADMELYELAQLSGITMDPHVFEILLDLLRKNVSPDAIVEMLRSMCLPAYQQLHNQKVSHQTAPPPPTSSSVSLGAALSKSASALSSGGALRADHSLARGPPHSGGLQERSAPSSRRGNHRPQSDVPRGSQTVGSRKKYTK
ncbi:mitotic-spindle organizing protein 2B [Elysia marginata]|uniref:Mitotic-spindle organizing protein 2B n=1 Tax=Elysia marginata TaxID=1093978 RepID=A0AAV4G2Q0_9GAST|nr:mitotic-spindle organizing protein 2B [Elysia marginata]